MFNPFSKKKDLADVSADFYFYVIDDEEEIREILAMILNSLYNCKIKQFESADLALESLKTEIVSPDAIMSDVMMPGISGFKLRRILQSEGYRIPMILITSLEGDEIFEESEQSNIVICKPFSKSHIHSVLNKVLKIAEAS